MVSNPILDSSEGPTLLYVSLLRMACLGRPKKFTPFFSDPIWSLEDSGRIAEMAEDEDNVLSSPWPEVQILRYRFSEIEKVTVRPLQYRHV